MCPEPGEQFQVRVDIAGERFGHLLFHFAELLLQFVERFVLLVHGHELLVGALPFEVFAVGVVDFFRGVYQFREPFRDEAELFHGEIVNLRDVITFQGESARELRQALQDSVDEYLEFCRERGEDPEKPFSGKIFLRLSPALHRKIFIQAKREKESVNRLITNTLEKAFA